MVMTCAKFELVGRTIQGATDFLVTPSAPIHRFERLHHTCDYVIDPAKVLDGKGMYKSP